MGQAVNLTVRLLQIQLAGAIMIRSLENIFDVISACANLCKSVAHSWISSDLL